MSDNERASSAAEIALAQALVAFGGGLGALFVSSKAAKAGLKRFRHVIEDNSDDEKWERNLPALVEYARAIGRVTAHETVSRGSNTVTARDFLEALGKVERARDDEEPGALFCPFIHPHRTGPSY